jgi:hypothetical protein
MRWLAAQIRVEVPIQEPAERKIAKNKPKSSLSSRFGIAQAELLHPNTDIDDSRGIVGGYRQSQWRVPHGEKCNQGSGESRSEEAGSARESGCSGEEGGGQEAGCESSRCEARSKGRAGESPGKEAGSQEEVAPGPRPCGRSRATGTGPSVSYGRLCVFP